MKRTVEKGKTLLVDGPASVSLLSGQVEVLGAPLKIGSKIIIRDGKRIPFEIRQSAEFDVMVGENARVEETDGSTIPASWENASRMVLSQREPTVVMVIGGVDSGKTSLCAYLANRALKENRKVSLVDADLGQSDIGPPSTIGLCRLSRFVKDPFDIRAENVYFVGATSPSGAVDRVVEGLTKMKNEALRKGAIDVLIINTDGWVDGEDAVRYKVELTEKVAPNIVVGIQQKDELAPLLTALKEKEVVSVESSPAVRKRDRDKRRVLRELSYKKYLKGAKVELFPLSWVRVKGIPLGIGMPPSDRRIEELSQRLEASLVYCEETPSTLLIVVKKGEWVDEERVKGLEQGFGKKVQLMQEGYEEGLLVALYDDEERFLGIGIIQGIDFERRFIKLYTPVSGKVSSITVGMVKLDKKGREIGLDPAFADW